MNHTTVSCYEFGEIVLVFGTITEFMQCVVEIITSNSWSPEMKLEKAVAPNPKLWRQLHSKT
jgi:hypothetical protein